jgi:hypothetical protein
MVIGFIGDRGAGVVVLLVRAIFKLRLHGIMTHQERGRR